MKRPPKGAPSLPKTTRLFHRQCSEGLQTVGPCPPHQRTRPNALLWECTRMPERTVAGYTPVRLDGARKNCQFDTLWRRRNAGDSSATRYRRHLRQTERLMHNSLSSEGAMTDDVARGFRRLRWTGSVSWCTITGFRNPCGMRTSWPVLRRSPNTRTERHVHRTA